MHVPFSKLLPLLPYYCSGVPVPGAGFCENKVQYVDRIRKVVK